MAKNAGGVVFERVTKRYGEVTAVDDVSFRVAPSELVTLLGPSGCGKTTTLRMVAGLEPVSSGRIVLGDNDVTRRAANERDVSMVFQSYALFPHMTVLENVCYGPLSTRADKPKARELAHAKLRRRVRQEIRELQQSLSLTVIYVTHDQEEALAVSDHIIVMEGGRIAQQGTPNELYESPATRFLADFIGDANLIDGDLVADSGRAIFCAGGVSAPVRADGLGSGPATLALRPHRLRIVDAD